MSPVSLSGLNAGLRKVYESSGYRRYKMSKFEEYDLYAGNRSFLANEKVVTFTDTDGKLLALKPDVTLSIVKNWNGKGTAKLYYRENVYRSDEMGFREISQTGLECVGNVDEYAVCEVLGLAAKSLRTVSDRYELDVSHLGLVCDLLKSLPEISKKTAVDLIGGKNIGDLKALLSRENISEEIFDRIIALAELDCPASEAAEKLSEILAGYVSWERLQLFCDTCGFLGQEFPGKVRVDFSTVGDLSYYSGIIFRGYIGGIPQSILSGGQYDGLMKKLDKNGRAIGFAIYLDRLESLFNGVPEFDCDALLLYSDEANAETVYCAAKALQDGGKKVLCAREIPENLKFREIYRLTEGGAVKID